MTWWPLSSQHTPTRHIGPLKTNSSILGRVNGRSSVPWPGQTHLYLLQHPGVKDPSNPKLQDSQVIGEPSVICPFLNWESPSRFPGPQAPSQTSTQPTDVWGATAQQCLFVFAGVFTDSLHVWTSHNRLFRGRRVFTCLAVRQKITGWISTVNPADVYLLAGTFSQVRNCCSAFFF